MFLDSDRILLQKTSEIQTLAQFTDAVITPGLISKIGNGCSVQKCFVTNNPNMAQ